MAPIMLCGSEHKLYQKTSSKLLLGKTAQQFYLNSFYRVQNLIRIHPFINDMLLTGNQ